MRRPLLDVVLVLIDLDAVWLHRRLGLGRLLRGGGRYFNFRVGRLLRWGIGAHGGRFGRLVLLRRRSFVRDTLGTAGQDLRVQRSRRFRLPALARHLGVFENVLGIAGGTTRLLHLRFDHRDYDVVRDSPLARTIIVKNVTKPRLALLHQNLPTEPFWRGKNCERC
jgi:hypothetical protein